MGRCQICPMSIARRFFFQFSVHHIFNFWLHQVLKWKHSQFPSTFVMTSDFKKIYTFLPMMLKYSSRYIQSINTSLQEVLHSISVHWYLNFQHPLIHASLSHERFLLVHVQCSSSPLWVSWVLQTLCPAHPSPPQRPSPSFLAALLDKGMLVILC